MWRLYDDLLFKKCYCMVYELRMFSVPLLLSIKLHTSIYLALFHVFFCFNMWNRAFVASATLHLLYVIFYIKIKLIIIMGTIFNLSDL